MNISPRFIVVDDDKFNNALCVMVISKICPESEVLTFHDPVAGFEHLVKEFPNYTRERPMILLLDINMPGLDGWKFLDRLNETIQDKSDLQGGKLIIYVLSSSVDKKDIDKALQYKNVVDYIIKPITKDIITKITRFEMNK